MAWRIVKQKNGLYGIWSTVVDNFIYVNCNKKDILKAYIDDYTELAKRHVESIFKYPQFRKNKFMEESDALDYIKRIHGKKEYNDVLELLGYRSE